MTASRLGRAAYLFLAPAVCLIFFWRALFTWFFQDDFAWLSLPLEVNRFSDLGTVLFSPKAQGTIRFISERLYFLLFGSIFDMSAFSVNALPFRICALLTWFASLTLATLIGTRLLRSRAAGVVAAVLWTASAALVRPLAWASAYNQALIALCILLAFYGRLRWLESGKRAWMLAEWGVYLAGFGVLEIVVMYPALALLHALIFDASGEQKPMRRFSSLARNVLPLFIPAIVFAAIHFLLIPKTAGENYSLAVDHRLPATLWRYITWTLAPVQIGEAVGEWRLLALIFAPLTGFALLGFAIWRLRQRDFAPLFCTLWFLLFLLPVLPLPDHLTDYYLTVPALGLAWLAGAAAMSAWNTSRMQIVMRATILVMAAAYLAGSYHQTDIYLRWLYSNSNRMRKMLAAVDETGQNHPGTAILLAGVDNSLLDSGFEDNPFRLYGLEQIYIVPGTLSDNPNARPLGDYQKYMITVARAIDLIDHGKARVLAVSRDPATDVTRSYGAVLRSGAQRARHDFVNAGDVAYADQLGPTWYKPESGACWMPKSAAVHLYEIQPGAQKLFVTGYASPDVVGSGAVVMRFKGNGQDIGVATVQKPAGPFSFSFALPSTLIGKDDVTVEVDLSKVFHPPADDRDLGMVFGTFAIR